MKIPRPFFWLIRLVVLTGFAVFFGKYIRTSGPYLGHATRLLPNFHETLIRNDLHRTASVSIAPDGRVFLVGQDGVVRIIQNEVLLPEPFVTVDAFDYLGEGLFHLTFDPAFATNSWVYLYYVTLAPRRNRLLRVTAQGNRTLPESFGTLWESPPLTADLTHHGGSPVFDDAGLMYLGIGDSTSPATSTGQSLATPYGKILRLTRAGAPAPGNPFANTPGALPEIFALGLRNPYSLARDPVTGTILVSDVGENTTEEINQLDAGGNYGWNVCEGDCAAPVPKLRDPLVAYFHGIGTNTGCAIIGGAFYHPDRAQFPAAYRDKYFYADLCSGWMRTLDLQDHAIKIFATGLTHVQDIDIAPDGSLYYLTRGISNDFYSTTQPGQLWRVTYQPP